MIFLRHWDGFLVLASALVRPVYQAGLEVLAKSQKNIHFWTHLDLQQAGCNICLGLTSLYSGWLVSGVSLPDNHDHSLVLAGALPSSWLTTTRGSNGSGASDSLMCLLFLGKFLSKSSCDWVETTQIHYLTVILRVIIESKAIWVTCKVFLPCVKWEKIGWNFCTMDPKGSVCTGFS